MTKCREFPGELPRRERRHTLVFRTSDTRRTGFGRSELHLGLSMDTVALGPVPSENLSLALSLPFQQRSIFFHSSFWFFSNRIFSWYLINFYVSYFIDENQVLEWFSQLSSFRFLDTILIFWEWAVPHTRGFRFIYLL